MKVFFFLTGKKALYYVMGIFMLSCVSLWQKTYASPLFMGPPCESGGPVTTVGNATVCAGTTTVDIPVKVASFASIGIMSLKLTYESASLGTPVLISSCPLLWPNFVVNTDVAGIITASGYGPGLTLDDNTILFTLRFTNSSGLSSGTIVFTENAQGTTCEYGSGPPNYTTFCDTPTEEYYINGGVVVNTPVAVAIYMKTDVPCFGGDDGSATVSASGGTSTYNYLWNNGQTSVTVSGLTVGSYTVTVTDALTCATTASVEITQPLEALSVWISNQINVTTYKGNDGSLSVSASGGTSGYTYLWNDGQTTATATSLTAGGYMVTVTDAQSCSAIATAEITQPDAICLNLKVFLQGPYVAEVHMMRDDLRSQGFIPAKEPYSAAPYNAHFTHAGGGGGETVSNPGTVFGVTGSDAIVDWVFIELRDKSDQSLVKYTRSALVQRDGDVVDVDGVSPVCFHSLSDYQFYVTVRHRNHLGVMTANIKSLLTQGTTIDFSNGSETEFNWGTGFPGVGDLYDYTGLSQSTPETGKRALWFGDANSDHEVLYQVSNDDQSVVLSNVITCPGNSSRQCGYNYCLGYYDGDVDMNGKVKFEPPYDDQSQILLQVIFYPLNTTYQTAFDYVREQLP
jgi:hypothetical protein